MPALDKTEIILNSPDADRIIDPKTKFIPAFEKLKSKKGTWDKLLVTIYRHLGFGNLEIVTYYERNYPSFMNTFCHFKKNDKWYALVSRNYTCTEIIDLDKGEFIGGEIPNEGGFCPIDFYIPKYQVYFHKDGTPFRIYIDASIVNYGEATQQDDCYTYENFGFVAGCIWGDDSSMKIQYLDLSNVEKGIIKREEKFGYLELPDFLSLKQSIFIEDDGFGNEDATIRFVTNTEHFSLK